MSIQIRVPQQEEGMLQSGGNAMATTGLTHTVKGMYVPAMDAYAGVAQVAKQVAGVGDAFFKFAVEQEKIKQQAEAQHGLNEMNNQLSKAYADYSLLEGQNAIDGYDKYQETVNKIKQQTFSAYDRTNFIQRAVQGRGEEITSQFQQQGYAHQASETVKWRDAENQAAIDKAASDALTFFNDPVLSAEAWNRWEKQVGIFLYNKGIDANSDVGKQAMTKLRTDALSSLVDYSINTKQYGTAQSQLAQFKEKMAGDDYIKLLGRLRGAQIADAEQAARHKEALRNQEYSNLLQAARLAEQIGDLPTLQAIQAKIQKDYPQSASLLEHAQKRWIENAEIGVQWENWNNGTPDFKHQNVAKMYQAIEQSWKDGKISDLQRTKYTNSVKNEMLKLQKQEQTERSQHIKEVYDALKNAVKNLDYDGANQLEQELKEYIGQPTNNIESAIITDSKSNDAQIEYQVWKSKPDADKLAGADTILNTIVANNMSGNLTGMKTKEMLNEVHAQLEKAGDKVRAQKVETLNKAIKARDLAYEQKDMNGYKKAVKEIATITGGVPRDAWEAVQLNKSSSGDINLIVESWKEGSAESKVRRKKEIEQLVVSAGAKGVLQDEQVHHLLDVIDNQSQDALEKLENKRAKQIADLLEAKRIAEKNHNATGISVAEAGLQALGNAKTEKEIALMNEISIGAIDLEFDNFMKGSRYDRKKSAEELLNKIALSKADPSQKEWYGKQITQKLLEDNVEAGRDGLTPQDMNEARLRILEGIERAAFKAEYNIDITDPKVQLIPSVKPMYETFVRKQRNDPKIMAERMLIVNNNLEIANESYKASCQPTSEPFRQFLAYIDQQPVTSINPSVPLMQQIDPKARELFNMLDSNQRTIAERVINNKFRREQYVSDPVNYDTVQKHIEQKPNMSREELRQLYETYQIPYDDRRKLEVVRTAKALEVHSQDTKNAIQDYQKFLENQLGGAAKIDKDLGMRNVIDYEVSNFKIKLARELEANGYNLKKALLKVYADPDVAIEKDAIKRQQDVFEDYIDAIR